jgi:glycerol-3-phosphate dehydrogenase (NAD(P)+)
LTKPSLSTAANNVLIIGYGEMGHAFEYLLAPRHELHIWDIHPVPGHVPVDLEHAAASADFVIYCVPTGPVEELAARIFPALSSSSLSLSCAKGLDEKGRPAAAALHAVYGDGRNYGVVYGPMISEEIRAGRPAFAQLGVRERALFDRVTALFAQTSLQLDYTEDVIGISWSVILKNVYAILFGAADELGLGDNVRGFLTVAALRELDAIVTGFGGKAAAPYHLAGLGDLITTATSAGSHHHALGGILVRGELDRISGEGVHTLATVRKYALLDIEMYPMFALVESLVSDPEDIQEKIGAYLEGWFQPRVMPFPGRT